ncbi:MAG: phosphoribosylformylglycinamidine synthase subunit PurQ [Desulfamplus sp.]|nr:phosphoribosylformylglycinamidine synthase subunit PurQ [Desulfamplus sp.]MBF0411350.1 phosphoribosylformylglycinamidine synthase subunit PurQ [Desulfamplus sp.]
MTNSNIKQTGYEANNRRVKVLVLTGFGLNCDIETAHAFETAGAQAHRIHINSLISGKVDLDDFHILAFGGGFSWGDDHGAGVIQALKLKNHIGEKILSFVNQGKLVIGICNGFQTLVNLGLLPGIDKDYQTRSVALTWNDCGNFRDQWVNLSINPDSPCVFTKGLISEKFIELPIRHAQGKFVAEKSVVERLIANNQVVLRYADENPNGSVYEIAGICDSSGHIFGLMPHPEAYNHYTNHPDWTRKAEQIKRNANKAGKEDKLSNIDVTQGMKIFINGVNYMASRI